MEKTKVSQVDWWLHPMMQGPSGRLSKFLTLYWILANFLRQNKSHLVTGRYTISSTFLGDKNNASGYMTKMYKTNVGQKTMLNRDERSILNLME
jgi:hypothetical protein